MRNANQTGYDPLKSGAQAGATSSAQASAASLAAEDWKASVEERHQILAEAVSCPHITPQREGPNVRVNTSCEIPHNTACWLMGFHQGGFVEKYLNGKVCIGFRKTETSGGESKQNGFIFGCKMLKGRFNPRDGNSSSFHQWLNTQQSFMFSQNIELMEGKKKSVSSFVSFHSFDRGSFSGSDPLFSFKHIYGSQKIIGGLSDGKVGVAIRYFAVARQYSGHENIQCGPYGIDNSSSIPYQHGIQGDSKMSDEKFVFSVIRIRLYDKLIWAAPLPRYETLLKDWDMGVGPMDGI